MRIPCPLCGERDAREFSMRGGAEAAVRPLPDAGAEAWDAFMHLRANPAGDTRELWYHGGGCGAWLVVARNTVSHEVLGASLAEDAS